MSKALHKAPLFFINTHLKSNACDVAPTYQHKAKPATTHSIDTLFRAHWRDVCRLLHKCYGSGPPEPEDVAQEAFSRFAQMSNTADVQDPKAYIIKIAINITLKSIGRICKTRAFIAEQLPLNEELFDEICPETILQGEQRIAAIQKGTERLSDKQRDVLMRARIKGQTYAQISNDTGWSLADICRQLNTAMAILESIDDEIDSNSVKNKHSEHRDSLASNHASALQSALQS
ncbi:sigma-70 family RNA polymerase sigma factor [Paraglaciecola sp. 20A4]|uniref:RNA polymerase sigma factor n=1 Tax=Paraglaciecola sp. 20A4 TaxID=2687288 RepID=UPI00140DE739|nr:sigma-70 family RNA polymerase sigma factor [Paraglaciecola sp. 20A4]